jgi:hypothetical protein
MLNWARFLVNVATGSTLTFTRLKDVAEISALFPSWYQSLGRDRLAPRQDGLGAGVGREGGGSGRRAREAQGEGDAVGLAQTTSPWRIVFSVTTRGSTNWSR